MSKIEELAKRNYVFMYDVIDNDVFEHLTDGGVRLTLSAEEIEAIAKKWDKDKFYADCNGSELPRSLNTRLWKNIEKEIQNFCEQNGYEQSDLSALLRFPFELELAINELLGVPTDPLDSEFDPLNPAFPERQSVVEMHYTLIHNGERIEETCPYGLLPEIAYMMQEILTIKPEGIKDFEYMKEVAPKAYEYVRGDMHTWCNNKHLAEWGELVDIELCDFPEEIYDIIVD